MKLLMKFIKEAYICALNRFVVCRGKPKSILTDNGTNFVRAFNELYRLLQESIDASHFTQEGIEFTFSAPYSPHFNGLAKAAVRSTKHHLKRLLEFAYLTYEEMSNLLRQIEAILNSRPLTPLSNDPLDLSALTSSHFLIGRPLLSALRPPIADASITRLGRYKRVELLKQHVWQRLNLEYVSMLQLKHKWTVPSINMRPGALVLIKDKALPPLLWFLGRLVEIYPGSDGAVAEVKTKKGTLQRGFNNISPLPLS